MVVELSFLYDAFDIKKWLKIKWSIQILLSMARLPAPSALGHDIAARYLALGYGMTVIPKVPR